MTPFTSPGIALPALIAVNLLPLSGVLFFNWSVYEVLLLYWSENIIIGIFNLARFWTLLRRQSDYSALFIGPFFCVHYGGFALGHYVFLQAFFGPDSGGGELSAMFTASFLALLASHGISYFVNFLGKREYERTTTKDLMSAPYARVVVLHLTVLFGGFGVMALGEPWYALAILVLVKLGIDIAAHRREHRRLEAQQEPTNTGITADSPATDNKVFRRWRNE